MSKLEWIGWNGSASAEHCGSNGKGTGVQAVSRRASLGEDLLAAGARERPPSFDEARPMVAAEYSLDELADLPPLLVRALLPGEMLQD